jgi:penicillin-binding protein 1A
MLQDVIRVGTGRKALSLGRPDLAGKTGTTNDAQDAWFAGYQRNMAALAWVGYDQPRSLGERETGGGLALPIWMDFMREALKKVPVSTPEIPEGVLRINGELYSEKSAPGVGVSSLGLEDPVTIEELLFQKSQAGQTGN